MGRGIGMGLQVKAVFDASYQRRLRNAKSRSL